MATVESVMTGARSYLRDQPRFFSAAVAAAGLTRTFKLGHKNVMAMGLYIAGTDGTDVAVGQHDAPGFVAAADTFSYVIDEREGLLRIVQPRTGGFSGSWSFNIEGYYLEWIADVDLRYFANNIIAEHAYHKDTFLIENISDLEEDCIAIGAACEALWSLFVEYARDIDINTPEGIALPATQRFRQVEDLLFNPNGLLAKYKSKANMLGVGLDRIEVFTLRRLSRVTNRLVPIYRPREWDDAGRPVRVFPPIDQEGQSNPQPDFLPAASVTSFFEVGEAFPNP